MLPLFTDTNSKGEKKIIQEHSAGHEKGDQGPGSKGDGSLCFPYLPICDKVKEKWVGENGAENGEEAKCERDIPCHFAGDQSLGGKQRDGSLCFLYLLIPIVKEKKIIQEHSAGHEKGDQGPHFNVRPADNPRTGNVPGTKDHYSF